MLLTDFTDEELKAEIQRRNKEKEAELLSSADYKKRMNIAVKKNYSKETEDEIAAVMLINPEYENNIQKALAWGLKTGSKELTLIAIKTYKGLSNQKYLDFIPHGIELKEILFAFSIDDEVGYKYLSKVLNYWVDNELLLLKMKRQGGVERLYYDWCGISTGYDREMHRTNRKRINDVLEQAKESYPYCKKFRKAVLAVLRDVQACHYECQEDIDILGAFKFLHWDGARWGKCNG